MNPRPDSLQADTSTSLVNFFYSYDINIQLLVTIIYSLLTSKPFLFLQIDDPLSNLSASVGKRCNFFKLQERVGAPCGSQTTSNDFYCRLQQQGLLQSLHHSDLRNKESNVSRIQNTPISKNCINYITSYIICQIILTSSSKKLSILYFLI